MSRKNGRQVGQSCQAACRTAVAVYIQSFSRSINGSFAPEVGHWKSCQNLLKIDVDWSEQVHRGIKQCRRSKKRPRLRPGYRWLRRNSIDQIRALCFPNHRSGRHRHRCHCSDRARRTKAFRLDCSSFACHSSPSPVTLA